MVNAYVDADSRMHLAASARKVRQGPAYTGATTLGITEHNEEVLALTGQLVRAIGYTGVLDIGWRFDARDGRYKVLDLNPRVGATFRLFAAPSGADVVRALYADLTGCPVPDEKIPDGRRWLSEFHDLGVARTYIRDGVTTPLGYLRSLRGASELVWCASDDMRPALTALGRAAREWRTRRSRRQSRVAYAGV
jgi:predicted ATP-grasp superfamily ATP-dependent carboligase